MREFFKGWRRKVGVVTLAMACVLMVGWVRSINGVAIGIDRFRFPCGTLNWHEIASFRRGLLWERVTLVHKSESPRVKPGTEPALFNEFSENLVQYQLPHLAGVEERGDERFEWRSQYCGFDGGELRRDHEMGVIRATFWIIPYYAIVIPLTVISAFLFLSTPRQSTSKKISEPNGTAVGVG
jgi:hypothetical protein